MSNTTISLAVLTLSACAAQGSMTDTTDPGNPTEPSDPSEPSTPTDPDPIVPGESAIAGEYQLRSDLAVTVGSLAPPPAYELLQDLENDPGAALVTLAEAAGVPAAESLFAALPSSLSSRVTGWMTDAIGASAELQTLMAWSQVVLAETEVRSTLSSSPLDSEEHASASHVLDSMIFDLDGREIEQDIPSITGLPGAGHADLELWIERDAETRELVMGEHRFGLLFGEAAYRAFEDAVTARYGTDLRGILGSSLDCAAMAAEVSNQCVLSICVGHADELESLCSGALDAAVDQIHDQFTAFDTELLRFSFGSAIVTSNEEGRGTVLETGEWTASADFGLGLRALEASFTGVSAP
jgi:hypothetical protein